MATAPGCSDDAQQDGGTPDASAPDSGQKDRGPDRPKPDALRMAAITGYLQNTSGTAITGDVIVCNETDCKSESTTASGAFSVFVDSASTYLFHIQESKKGNTHYADVLFPVVATAADISGQKKIDVGKVVVPAVPKTVALDIKTGGNLDLGNGVTLKVAANSGKYPPLTTKADVGAVLVETKYLHPNLLKYSPKGSSVTPDAVYAFMPLTTSFNPTADFEMPAPSGLTSGDKLEIYSINEETTKGDIAKISLHGEAEINSSGKMVAVSGKGIKQLTWFMFYKK
jgi:hypothetical protein